MTTTKTLIAHEDRSLVQHLTSGDCWIVDSRGGQGIALDHAEVDKIQADPSLMDDADLAAPQVYETARMLYILDTNACPREATEAECEASDEAAKIDGGVGAFLGFGSLDPTLTYYVGAPEYAEQEF